MGEFGDLSGITYHAEERRYLSGNQRMAIIGQAEPVIEQTFDAPQPDGTISRGYIMYQGNRFEYRAVSGWSVEKSEMAMLIANHAGGSDDWDELSGWGPDVLKSCGFDDEMLKVTSRDFGALTNFLESEQAEREIDEVQETIRPREMARILVSVPIDQAADARAVLDELRGIDGIEIIYGAN